MIPPAAIGTLPKRLSLVEQTSARLAEHIASLTAASGEGWLPSERDLAARFGVSRPVVREATKRLELQGLLEISHGRGIRVVSELHRPVTQSLELRVPESFERLRQLNEARRLIEPGIASLAAERRSARALVALQECHRAMVESESVEAAASADAAFHEEIARAAGNEVIALILSSFGDLGEVSRQKTLAATGREKALEHHAAILSAIERRDGAEAERWMRLHLAEASRDLEESHGSLT